MRVEEKPPAHAGKKYCVNVEGIEKPWGEPTISASDIADLGGWDVSRGVILVDLHTQEERTLAPDEVIELRPGQGFCKRVLWKRG